jgi:hypothetical protein
MQLRRESTDKEAPTQELVALQAKHSAMVAKHEEALGKLAALQADKEAAESARAAALCEAAAHQQNARAHAIRSARRHEAALLSLPVFLHCRHTASTCHRLP